MKDSQHKPKHLILKKRKGGDRVFAISDLHFPYHNKKALQEVYQLIKKHKPTVVVQIGDLLDQYTFSRFSRSLEITPEVEIRQGLKDAIKFWETIKKLVPKAKCIQLLGNHDVRLSKKIMDKFPELAGFFSPAHLYQFKGVHIMRSDRDFVEVDGVIYTHGFLGKGLDHAKYFNKPCVQGHLHRPSIETEGRLWNMNVGFLADDSSSPLSYTTQKFSKWRLASGMVDNGEQPTLFFLKG